MDTDNPPHRYTVAILSRGDAAARRDATAQNSRFVRVFEALAAVGIEARPVVYDEAFADAVRDQLLAVDGVLVWVDPIHQGKTRAALDPLLRDVAAQGPWVSAHPDVILKMGVKEVLYRTRHLGWGADTHRYDSAATFRAEFPPRLRARGPRVLKQNRGNGGQGVWKVEALPDSQRDGPGAPCAARQHAGGHAARCFHRAMRAVFRLGRLHHRSGVSASPAGRNDPLLHERLEGRGLRPSTDQGLDPAAAARPGLAGSATGTAHHARTRCRRRSRRCDDRWRTNGRRR